MKQTRTTLKELTAMYRAVLRHGILCNAIALGLIATATPAMAEYTNVSLDELYPTGTAGSFKYTGNQNVTWLAENISVTEPGDGRAIEIGDNAMYSATEPTLLHLGGDNTNAININTGGDGILVRTKSVVDVHANDTISITSTVNDPSYDGGVGYGALWVQNSSDPGQTDTYATANLTANQINLTNLNASAIAALSEGRVNINGNATIKGKDAIYASGLSETNINAAGDKTVKMEGDIDFRQGPDSGTPVDATVNVTLNGAESYWTGNTVLSYVNKPSDDNKLQINHGATIKMTDGATWTATEVAESAEPGVATNGRYYTALKNLDVNSGNVVVNRANGIEVENLAVGANGLNISNGKMDISKSLTSGGQIHVNSGAELNVNATDGATFANSSSNDSGGAIYNKGTLTLADSSFADNTATERGGAVFNYGEMTIDDVVFTSNGTTSESYPSQGGAIYNAADVDYLDKYGILTISNTTFGDANDSTKGNIAMQGGAISNDSGNGYNAELTLNNTNFYYNKAQSVADGGYSALGGAIHNESNADVTVTGGTIFKGNSAVGRAAEGGAIYNSSWEKFTFNDAVTFDSNIVEDTNGANGGFGGAISNADGTMIFKDVATFTNNKAIGAGQTSGGAVHNAGTLTFENGASFEGNEAMYGGALFNKYGSLTITDASFTKNQAGGEGGAIFNLGGTTNINAVTENVIFSGNTADEEVNDITNYYGTLNFNAANGKSISLEGISGPSGTLNINSVGGNTGTVEISEYLANHTVNVDAGELHLTTGEANLYKSNVFVADGATINTIDDEINDYMTGEGNNGTITLADGAGIMGDIDFENGIADKYASDAGTVTYKMANLIGAVGSGVKNIQVASDGTRVNKDAGFGWFNSVSGLTLESSGAADGMIKLTGLAGGISEAADASAMVNEIKYDVTADEALTTSKSLQNNVVISGDGTGASGKELELAGADLTVVDGADVTINDLKLAGTGALNNAATAIMRINDSLVGVKLRNAGILYSDPTTYTDTLINTGIANIDGDTFASTGKLENYNVANLTNATFDAGAEILGSGTTNLVSGTTAFNNTANANTVHVASGADFTGALAGGTLDTHNGTIDTISGSFGGGNVVLDAKLGTTNAADSIAGNTGTIKEINILGTEYGTADSATLTTGGTLDSNVQINGMNYYTSVVDNGDGTVTFSDKLINESNLYSKLGSWSGGNYIKSNVDLTHAADSDHLTVGGALSALDTQLKMVSTAGTIAAGQTGFVTGDAVNTALAGKQATITNTSTIIADGTGLKVADGSIGATQLAANSVSSANIIDGTITFADLNSNMVATSTSVNVASPSDEKLVTEKAVVAGITNLLADKQAWTDSTLGITSADADAVQNAYAGTNYLSTATTLTGADKALDTAIKNNADAIAGIVDGTTYTTEMENNVKGTINAAAGTGLTASSGVLSVNTATSVADGNTGYVTSDLLHDQGYQTEAGVNSLIAAAVSGTGAVASAIDAKTKMADDHDDSTSIYHNFADGADVVTAVTALDSASKTTADKVTAIETGTTVVAKAAADENGNNIASTYATQSSLSLLNSAVSDNANAITTLTGDENTAGSVANAIATANAYTDAQLSMLRDNSISVANAYTDRRIEDLDKNLSAGVAGAVALSSVAVSGVERGEVSVGAGYGYFNGQSAAAFGATMGLSNRWSVNAGAGISNADVSFRAGTNYKFKLF